jgi:transcriptional regulator with XRE-family HTH domain
MSHQTTHNSVTELASAAGASAKFTKGLATRLAKRRIVNHLVALRGARELSQKDIADKLGCTQSKVSKLENSEDDDLRLGDLRLYADAIGLNLGLLLSERRLGSLGRIKVHAFQIRAELDRLVQMAKGDDAMTCGVAHVHDEMLYNLVRLVGDSLTKLIAQSAESLHDFDEEDDAEPQISVEMRVLPKDQSILTAASI